MSKKLFLGLVLGVVASLLLSTVASAGPIPPYVKKSLVEDPNRAGVAWIAPSDAAKAAAATIVPGGPLPLAGIWYLRNGAFDDDQAEVLSPAGWTVYAGDADEYGTFGYKPRTSAVAWDWGFAFTIINNEVKKNHNAYLYQEIALPAGDFWVDLHSSIYAYDSWTNAVPESTRGSYSYMTYYAIVPKSQVMTGSSFDPSAITDADWKELWRRSYVCSETTKGLWWPGACLYQERAETVSFSGGDYVFVLRAELKWPDWRAFAKYVFDDIQLVAADPAMAVYNVCDGVFCEEGFIWR